MPAVADSLFTQAAHEDSSNYEKRTHLKRGLLDSCLFSRESHKPTVSGSGGGVVSCDVLGRRVPDCDTTPMHATRRTTTESIKTTRSHRSHEKSAAGTARGTRKTQDGGRTNLLVPIVPASHDKVMVRSVRTCGRARTRPGVSYLYHCVNRRNDGNERFHTRAVWRLSRSGSRSGGRNETGGRGNETRGEA
jgi:hypothetical protein